jgi:hypothetical protein
LGFVLLVVLVMLGLPSAIAAQALTRSVTLPDMVLLGERPSRSGQRERTTRHLHPRTGVVTRDLGHDRRALPRLFLPRADAGGILRRATDRWADRRDRGDRARGVHSRSRLDRPIIGHPLNAAFPLLDQSEGVEHATIT